MVGRASSIVVVLLIVIIPAAGIWSPPWARAADVDFYGVEGRPVAFNVTEDPGGPVDRWWWDFQGDGVFDWSSAAGPNTTHAFDEPGTYYAVLKATLGNVTVRQWIYQVLVGPENEPPRVVTNPAYVETFRGEAVTLRGSAVDDGTVVLYEWDLDGDGTFDLESGTSATATWTYDDLGEHTAVLRATDDLGATGLATVTVVVRNQPPEVHGNGIVSDAEEVTLRVTADDPDGEVVSYAWDPGDGSAGVTTSVDVLQHRYDRLGTYRVNVTVTDSDGATATATFLVERVYRSPVHEVIASASASEVLVGETVTFHVEVVGEDGATYSIAWDLGDGNVSTQETVEHAYGEPGTYLVKVRAVDERDVAVEDDLEVRVRWAPNEPPVAVPSVEQWVRPGRNLRFSDASFDPDGWIVLWQWDFDGDGTFDHSNATDGNHTHVYADEGVYTAVLRVTDNRGEVGVATVNVKVDRDAPGEDDVDDSQGAAVCCGAMVVVMVATAYWAVRRSMATPRSDGGPAGEDVVDGEGPGEGSGEGEARSGPDEGGPGDPPAD